MASSEEPVERVHGNLYRLRPGAALLQVDDYEECAPGYPGPTEYVRRLAPITTEQGGGYSAWLYLHNRPTEHLPRIQSGDFLAGQNRTTT